MSFKENLLKKIEIDSLAAKVIASVGPPESDRKVDKEAMRALLEMAGNTLKVIDTPISSTDKERVQYYKKVASDEENPPISGEDAFNFLKDAALRLEPVQSTGN